MTQILIDDTVSNKWTNKCGRVISTFVVNERSFATILYDDSLYETFCFDDLEKISGEKLSPIYEDECVYLVCYKPGHQYSSEIEALDRVFETFSDAENHIASLNKEYYGELFVRKFVLKQNDE
jgi:hypothetical protein